MGSVKNEPHLLTVADSGLHFVIVRRLMATDAGSKRPGAPIGSPQVKQNYLSSTAEGVQRLALTLTLTLTETVYVHHLHLHLYPCP